MQIAKTSRGEVGKVQPANHFGGMSECVGTLVSIIRGIGSFPGTNGIHHNDHSTIESGHRASMAGNTQMTDDRRQFPEMALRTESVCDGVDVPSLGSKKIGLALGRVGRDSE